MSLRENQWLHLVAFLAVFFWAFLPEFRIVRSAQKAVKETSQHDRGSLRSITLLGGLAWPVAFLLIRSFPQFSFGPLREPLFWAGLAVMIIGSLLRRRCWRELGEFFTGNVTVRESQPVVDSGPYRLVRHPSYTAGLLMQLGMGLALGHWLALLAFVLLPLIAYLHRMHVEEQALASTLGKPYVDYMRRTKRLIPWVV